MPNIKTYYNISNLYLITKITGFSKQHATEVSGTLTEQFSFLPSQFCTVNTFISG